MRPHQRDQIAVQGDGRVGVLGCHLTSPAGDFAEMLVEVCPVAAANAIAASLLPRVISAGQAGLPLADQGVGALTDGAVALAEDVREAWAHVAQLDAEDARRKAEAEAERQKGRSRR